MNRLRKHGLRLTPQRAAILTILESKGKLHPSFSEICEGVRVRHPNVSQSTVLKNLVTFEELGIVRSFSFRGETHYELNAAPHVNFVDKEGRITDIDDEKVRDILDELVQTIKKRTGMNTGNLLVMMEAKRT